MKYMLTLFMTTLIDNILQKNNTSAKLVKGNRMIQFSTICKCDHLGAEGVEVQFFVLFVCQTLQRMLWMWFDNWTLNYQARFTMLKTRVSKQRRRKRLEKT